MGFVLQERLSRVRLGVERCDDKSERPGFRARERDHRSLDLAERPAILAENPRAQSEQDVQDLGHGRLHHPTQRVQLDIHHVELHSDRADPGRVRRRSVQAQGRVHKRPRLPKLGHLYERLER